MKVSGKKSILSCRHGRLQRPAFLPKPMATLFQRLSTTMSLNMSPDVGLFRSRLNGLECRQVNITAENVEGDPLVRGTDYEAMFAKLLLHRDMVSWRLGSGLLLCPRRPLPGLHKTFRI